MDMGIMVIEFPFRELSVIFFLPVNMMDYLRTCKWNWSLEKKLVKEDKAQLKKLFNPPSLQSQSPEGVCILKEELGNQMIYNTLIICCSVYFLRRWIHILCVLCLPPLAPGSTFYLSLEQ